MSKKRQSRYKKSKNYSLPKLKNPVRKYTILSSIIIFFALILILFIYLIYVIYNFNITQFVGKAFENPQKFSSAQKKLSPPTGRTINYYVSVNGNDNNPGTISAPFATLERARDAIRELKFANDSLLEKPVNVILRSGTYVHDKPFVLDGRDSGTEGKPITYQAAAGEDAVISGGLRVTTPWTVYDSKKVIFVTNLQSLLSENIEGFNSLFVNGQRAIRARTPNEGSYYSWDPDPFLNTSNPLFSYLFVQPELQEPCVLNSSQTCAPLTAFYFKDNTGHVADLRASWKNLNDTEVVFLMAFNQFRFRINRIDEANYVVFFDGQEVYNSGAMMPIFIRDNWEEFLKANAHFYDLRKYYVENVFEALDSDGEWYFDRTTGDLYYKPRAGEDLNNPSTEVIVPTVDELLIVQRDFDELALPESFTISHWIKTTDGATTLSNTGGYDGYTFGLSSGKIYLIIGENDNETLGMYSRLLCAPPSGVVINDNQWHLITGVVKRDLAVPENSKFTCYVDGVEGEDVPLSSAYENMQMRMPSVNPYTCPTCTVALDELRLYNRELTEAEIGQVYARNVPREGLLLSLSFENNLKDDSGSLKILRKSDGGQPTFIDGIDNGKALLFGNSGSVDDQIKFQLENAQHLHFKDLTFQYTDWQLPPEGYAGGQAGLSMHVSREEAPAYLGGRTGIANTENPSTVTFYLAEDSSFENNKIKHTGGYGLDAYGTNLLLKGNTLTDLGLGGIKNGHPDNNAIVASKRKRITYYGDGNEISDNRISGVGKVNPEGVGIVSMLSGNNRITHNEISDASYSGISVGWMWGILDTPAKNNSITYNNIHDIMKVFSDGGGIYTTGKQPGTIISNNFVHDYDYSPQDHVNIVSGIYMDEGSSDIEVKNNIVYNAGATSIIMGYGFDRIVDNNIFIDNQNSRDVWHGQLYIHNCRPTDSCSTTNTFGHNILYSSDPSWKLLSVGQVPSLKQEIFSKNLIFNSQKELDNSILANISCSDCIIANPLFKGGNNFMLSENSPAFSLGFKQFDLMKNIRLAGPRHASKQTTAVQVDTRLAKLKSYRR